MLLAATIRQTAVAAPNSDPVLDLGRGPVTVHLPPAYDPTTPTPLILVLHGYGSTSTQMENRFHFREMTDALGLIHIAPDGLIDPRGSQFWNATDACCGVFYQPDDSGYLRDLIEAAQTVANIDAQRIYIVGHSNGGFMAYRLACDHADLIAGIANIAGATWLDPAACNPSAPVHILHVHGTADTTVRYQGGCFIAHLCYPSAEASVLQWLRFNNCNFVLDPPLPPVDMDTAVPGAETNRLSVSSGCAGQGTVALWAIQGGNHTPTPSAVFTQLILEELLAHPQEQ
jgi:polyhydroxybutyrate depolymerase